MATEARTQCWHCLTLPQSFQGVPPGGMAPESWAPPGNTGLSSNSAFLLPPFVFFLLFPPRCFFPLLSKALCFLPLSLLPFCQSSLPQLQEQAEHCWDICGTTWTRYVCSGVSQGVLGHTVLGVAAPLSAMKSSVCSRVPGMGTPCLACQRSELCSVRQTSSCSQHGNVPSAVPVCCSGGTHGNTGSGGAREGSGWGKGKKRFPAGLLRSSYQLFFGASFPPELQLAPTCAAGMSSLLGAVSVALMQ